MANFGFGVKLLVSYISKLMIKADYLAAGGVSAGFHHCGQYCNHISATTMIVIVNDCQ